MKPSYRLVMMTSVLLCAFASFAHADHGHNYGYGNDDDIFVGDNDDTVKRFDIDRGRFVGQFVRTQSGGLHGPRGMIFRGSKLYVVNQNVNQENPGEVLRFDGYTGAAIDTLVPAKLKNPSPPYAPRGMVRGPDNLLYVGDVGTSDGTCNTEGRIALYDATTGAYQGDLDHKGFGSKFFPRGVVFGPDGYLYVTAFGCPVPTDKSFDPVAGYVLRFDPRTRKYVDTVTSQDKIRTLHRPEGIVFDRKGTIWVTSFRKDPSDKDDIDRVIRIDPHSGRMISSFDVGLRESRTGVRAAAQTLLFGPDGKLYLPIQLTVTVPQSPPMLKGGEVWRCNAEAGKCEVLVSKEKSNLTSPWYVIFRFSDPGTLDYQDD